MLTNARRNVSGCFPDVTGIKSSNSEFTHDTRTEIERHMIFHAEHVADLKWRKSELIFKSMQKRLTSIRNLLWASVQKKPTQGNSGGVFFYRKIRKRILEIQKRIFRFFGEIQKRIMNPKYPHSRRILRIKSKSGFLRFTTSVFFRERIGKKYFWQAVFHEKIIHNSYRTGQFSPNVFLAPFYRAIKERNRSKIVWFPANSHQKLH